ncbi:MAG: hypothetical protein ACI9HK_000736 [Pirellulaceae bacterium]|jgi:hypothetical protein
MQTLELCFSGPMLPATTLLLLTTAYWLVVILGAAGFDALDFDIDADGVGDLENSLSLGLIGLRFLNLGRVPLMIWLSIFALIAWLATALTYTPSDNETLLHNALILLRSGGIGIVATKILTQPLVKMFEGHGPVKGQDLIGKSCVITTHEATDRAGQARVKHEGGAPLLLNVRSQDGKFGKGDEAQIKDFDAVKNVYLVGKFNL